jgi:MFS family permease
VLNRLALPFLHKQAATVRWNFVANTLDGALYIFAVSFISLNTVVPVLVTMMGGSAIAVGMVPVIWYLGISIPQVFMAPYIETRRNRKQIMLRTGLIQRLAWLLLAVLMLLVTYLAPAFGLILLFLGLAVAAVAGSINMPVWFDLVARVTPVQLRGRLFAIRVILGALLGILAGLAVTVVLDGIAYPYNFSVLFLLAFIFSMVSFVFLVFIRDDDRKTRVRESVESPIRRVTTILRENRNYRHFLIADALIVMAIVAEAFYAVHAIARFGLTPGAAGHFIMIMTATTVVGSMFFGNLADRLGHRLNLVLAAGLLGLACILALVAPSIEVYYLVFITSALAIGLRHISRLPIVVELCSDEDRPTYIAVSSVLTAPFALFALFAGWGADRLGYGMVFLLAGACATASLLWLLFFFKEPRHEVLSDPQPPQ